MSLTEGFSRITLQGADAEKFLVGQVTVDVTKLDAEHYQTAAICDLKRRVHLAFGLNVIVATPLKLWLQMTSYLRYKPTLKNTVTFPCYLR